MLGKSVLRSRRGTGMILGLFALLILFAFGISFLCVASSSVITAKRDYLRARALEVAEAGVEKAVSYLRLTAPDGSTDGSWRTSHPSSNPDDHSGDTWWQETVADGESYKLCVRSAAGGDTTKIVITCVSTVTHGSATASRTLKVLLIREAENVNCWNNVIFGGVGQSGRSINGNVVMRGSVHLLGDGETFTDIDGDGRWDDNEPYTDTNKNGQYDLGEPFTDVDGDGHRDAREPFNDTNGNGTRDPALTVTDMASEMSGDANIGNGYNATATSKVSMPAALQSLLPPLPTKSFGGETVETLSAKLRVKNGRVDISGSARVGDQNLTGNAYKETMDGAYVSDGYGGMIGAAGVSSDNGTGHGYDLGDGVVTFPVLTDPMPPYATYQDYLAANSLVVGGGLALTPGTPFTSSNGFGSISYDGVGKVTISGIVYVTGDIVLNSSGKYKTLTYRGAGTLASTGDIYVHCNVLPETNFPLTDRLGLVAAHNMWIATGPSDAQLTLALAAYAQYKVKVGKQCELAGTLVSSYYEMLMVPHLYQVPELSKHLPPGLPGSDPLWLVNVRIASWQDQGGSSG